MDGGHLQIPQLGVDGCSLVFVGSDDPAALIAPFRQAGQNLLPDNIDLPLVQVAPGVVSGGGVIHGQYVRLPAVLGHDD